VNEDDLDAIGSDGTVRLPGYLPSANSLLFAAGCQGRQGRGQHPTDPHC
jgi:hypothetical protein